MTSSKLIIVLLAAAVGSLLVDGRKIHIQRKAHAINTYGGSASQFSYIANRLWKLDSNRLRIGTDIRISKQGKAPFHQSWRDYASSPLISYVSPSALNRPTYKAFLALLDNYISEVNTREQVTNGETSEAYTFLNAVLSTPVMKEAHKYLVQMGKSSSSTTTFKSQLYDLWFRSYYRSSANKITDSSGFEHVFVGETNSRQTKVLGFHSWLQFYLQEKKRNLDYLGYLKTGNNPNLIMTKFTWKKNMKQIGSFFIGTSPEFDMALYTVSYLMDFNKLVVDLAGTKIKVTCYGINRDKSIGTCYPDIAK